MHIVKTLNDYVKTDLDKEAFEALKPKLKNETCYVAVKNREFLKSYFAPLNDFVVYTTGFNSAYNIRAMASL